MKKTKRILTKHPQGKSGVNIDADKYRQVKAAILKALRKNKSTRFDELADMVAEEIQPTFVGSILWYFTTVKLDLEARGIIERVSQRGPQVIRLTVKRRKTVFLKN